MVLIKGDYSLLFARTLSVVKILILVFVFSPHATTLALFISLIMVVFFFWTICSSALWMNLFLHAALECSYRGLVGEVSLWAGSQRVSSTVCVHKRSWMKWNWSDQSTVWAFRADQCGTCCFWFTSLCYHLLQFATISLSVHLTKRNDLSGNSCVPQQWLIKCFEWFASCQ